MTDISTGKDADFSEERLVQRYNSDLAKNFGNLLNRTLNMSHKYRGGVLKPNIPPGGEVHLFEAIPCATYIEKQRRCYQLEFHKTYEVDAALGHALSIADCCNQLIEKRKPFALAKDAEKDAELDAVLYTLAEALRIIAIFLSPVLPKAAHGLFDQLNWKMDEQGKESRFHLCDAAWGHLPEGHRLGQPTPLFPQIEVPKAE